MGFSPPVTAAERRVAPSLHLPPGAAAVARLEPRGCRWPLGEPGEDGFGFCGALRPVGSSYCAAHAGLARRRVAGRGGRA